MTTIDPQQTSHIGAVNQARKKRLMNAEINDYIVMENGVRKAIMPKSLLGVADGPYEFRPEFEMEVPTFIDSRHDLVPPNGKSKGSVVLQYHVPFIFRGPYSHEGLPDVYFENHKGKVRLDDDGIVLCEGMAKLTGKLCATNAVNRSGFCVKHGGALHPADKKTTMHRDVIPDKENVDALDRVQKVVLGLIPVVDLTDEEITNGYVLNDAGQQISNMRLGNKLQRLMVKELMNRMNRLMQMNLPNIIKSMTKIATSEIVEPADRIKASIWLAERTMGKTPDVVVHADAGKVYEGIFERIGTGRREDFRTGVESERMDLEQKAITQDHSHIAKVIGGDMVDDSAMEKFIDAEVVDEEDELDASTKAQLAQYKIEHQQFLDENYVASSLSNYGRKAQGNSDSDDDEPGFAAQSKNALDHAESVVQSREELKENRKQALDGIKRAKNKRFAARAVGAPLESDEGVWIIEYKPMSGTVMVGGKGRKVQRACLHPPGSLTPARIEAIKAKQNDNSIFES